MRHSRRSARHGGQVLALVILSMTMLAALVMFVYNTGDQVNRRLATQHGADATAISGTGWMARGMNVVAMNNVGMSRMLGMVPVMDSLPLATEMGHNELVAWEQCLAGQLARGVPSTKNEYLRTGLESLRARMEQERDILKAMDDQVNQGGFHMEDVTFWRVRGAGGAPPHGKLWQAAVAMDEFSQATMASLGEMAQSDAVTFGRSNNLDTAFIVPVLPQMPAKRTTFSDFQPVLQGREKVQSSTADMQVDGGNGGAIPDFAYPHRLGPWARLMKWRDYISNATSFAWVPGTGGYGQTRGASAHVNVGGRSTGSGAMGGPAGSQGHWAANGWEVIGYNTYGPYSWAMRHIGDYCIGTKENPGHLEDTFFHQYMGQLGKIKLNYMFKDKTPVKIHYAQWKYMKYPDAKTEAEKPDVRVTQTMFYKVEIVSSVPENSPAFMSPGTYRTNGERPIAVWAKGWVDPGKWSVPKMADWIWKDNFTYETTEDAGLGIPLVLDATGQPTWHPVYVVDWWVFGGIDTGGEIEVVNPCDYDDGDALPAPILLDTVDGDYDSSNPDPDFGVRRKHFTYLGVARRHNYVSVMPTRFRNANPYGSTVAVSQAELFNNTSWDLWTQDWRAQLVPVTQWDDWMTQLQQGVSDAPSTKGQVGDKEVQDVLDYLKQISPEAAKLFMNH